MCTEKDHRQPHNPRNNLFHDEAGAYLQSLLKLIPKKPVPLTMSQQFGMAQLKRLENAPITEIPSSFK